ncbi:MAG: HU family DNA-binding protein [Deltaproteobacteria bacterium]|nr:HU family DNA-binding protein [Deltaproteobacteria bacterium]
MGNITKAGLVERVAERLETSQAEAGRVLEAVVEAIRSAVRAGNKVTLVGFATFEQKAKKARIGRNPKTGEEIKIPAKKVAKIKAAKGFLD